MTSAPLPTQFERATVGLGARTVARIINGLPAAAMTIAVALAVIPAGGLPPDLTLLIVFLVVASAWYVVNAILVLTQSRTIGSLAAGFEYRSISDGKRVGSLAFLKLLLTDILIQATGGIMGIIVMATYRDGQSMVDRWLGVVGVDPKRIRSGGTDNALAPPVMRVQQVTMPAVSTPPAATASGQSPQVPSGWGSGVSPSRPAAPPAAPPPRPMAQPPAPPPPPLPPAPAPPAPPQVQPANPDMIVGIPFGPRHTAPTPMRAAPVAPPLEDPKTITSNPPPPPMEETVLDAAFVGSGPRIQFDDDTVVNVGSPLVFGRHPVAPSEYPDARPTELVDPSMKMSKTHVVVFAKDDAVSVFDVGSRNGVIFKTDGTKSKIAPGVATEVPLDVTVHIGGRWFRVLP